MLKAMKVPAVVLAIALVATACTDDGGDDTTTGDATTGDATTGDTTGDTTGTTTDGTTDGGAAQGNVLARVQDNDVVVCGVNDSVPGFGVTDADGNFTGFDIDFCRAIAAGVLGDAEKVRFTPLTAQQRFTTLQSGEIDVLVRNTTWTASRDGTEGAQFATTTFYDGQGMMVNADAGITEIDELDGATICVLSGTTTETNLETRFVSAGLEYTPATYEDNDTLQEAFSQGQCDGWTSDKSQLAGVRSAWPEGPDALTILDESFSKEPLGPAVQEGDQDWYDLVNWVVLATIQAEELGITQANVDEMRDSDNPAIATFLGDGASNVGLGISDDFNYQIIKQVGNYGEIYERNVGSQGIGLERCASPDACQNGLWTEGGLLYAPPFK